jgi:hypothetical protein
MSNIFTTSRAALIALTVLSPAAALAQTPREVANLVWQQQGVPAYVSTAPSASSGFAGAGSAIDVARSLPSAGLSAQISRAPTSGAVFATGFGAQDVARLSGGAARGLFATGTDESAIVSR